MAEQAKAMTYADRIEAMARAICRLHRSDPDALTTIPISTVRHSVEGSAPPSTPAPAVVPAWHLYAVDACAADRACLKTLEQPTEEMCNAAFECFDYDYDHPSKPWIPMWSKIDRGEK